MSMDVANHMVVVIAALIVVSNPVLLKLPVPEGVLAVPVSGMALGLLIGGHAPWPFKAVALAAAAVGGLALGALARYDDQSRGRADS